MSIDISSEFTPEGVQKLKKGMLLRFKNEDVIQELRITYINKNTGKVRANYAKTYHPDEVDVINKDN